MGRATILKQRAAETGNSRRHLAYTPRSRPRSHSQFTGVLNDYWDLLDSFGQIAVYVPRVRRRASTGNAGGNARCEQKPSVPTRSDGVHFGMVDKGLWGMSSVDTAIVQDIVRRVVEAAQPQKVILFGSRARGEFRRDSDFDLLVIKESDEPRYRRSIPLYVALADLPVEVEVVVYTPEEVAEWSEVPQAFVTTAVREGTTIYERRG